MRKFHTHQTKKLLQWVSKKDAANEISKTYRNDLCIGEWHWIRKNSCDCDSQSF